MRIEGEPFVWSQNVVRGWRRAGAGVLVLSLLSGCSIVSALLPPEPPPDVSEVPVLKTVKYETVRKQRIEAPVLVQGEVRSSVQMNIVARTGGKVEEVLKRIGDSVAEGETVARLSSEEAEFAKEQAEAALQQAKDALAAARQEIANQRREVNVEIHKNELLYNELMRQRNKAKNDYDSGKATAAQLSEAEVALEAARIDLDLARQQLKTLNSADALSGYEAQVSAAERVLAERQEALTALEVRAPIGGIITELSLLKGGSVGSGATIGRVDTLDPVQIVASLSEAAAGYVQGKSELLYILPNQEKQGSAKISYIAGVMDPKTRTYEMSLEAANADGALKPGGVVSLQLSADEEQMVIALPQYSVLKVDGDSYVFVLKDDIVEKRAVELGRSNAFYYEVLAGIEEGEKVVVTGQSELRDREQVIARPSSAETVEQGGTP